jgi:glycosyltransferase involved in cell wall biosynthesis
LEPPTVSLIIPVYNESINILSCLESIRLQNYGTSSIEILAYDGESSDNSYLFVDQFFNEHPIGRIYHNPKKTQSAAWNLGLAQSTGQIIGIVSAHSVLAPDYVTNIVETLIRTGADMVGGPTFADAAGPIGVAIAIALNSPFGVGNARFHYTTKEIEVDSVFMGACWRKTYEKIGGFDEELVRNQDDELSYRLRKAGGKIVCNPKIRSRYFNRSSLTGLFKQYFQYGFYKVRVLQKHPRQMSLRQFVPLVFVLSLLTSLILSLLSPWGWIPLIIVVGSYLVANFAASLYTAAKKGGQHLLLLPVVFATIHISYGSGFLVGLFKFWNRWGDKVGEVPQFSSG